MQKKKRAGPTKSFYVEISEKSAFFQLALPCIRASIMYITEDKLDLRDKDRPHHVYQHTFIRETNRPFRRSGYSGCLRNIQHRNAITLVGPYANTRARFIGRTIKKETMEIANKGDRKYEGTAIQYTCTILECKRCHGVFGRIPLKHVWRDVQILTII